VLNGKQLGALFKQFNQQYFGGKLPAYRIHVVRRITRVGESGRCLERRMLIEIQHGLPDEDAISTLLHEMAHAAHPKGGHSMPWKKEMIRLREAGAPLVPPDARVRLDDWDGNRVTRRMFRTELEDAFCGSPDDLLKLTLSQAIRCFVGNVGGPSTISAFLKKYPWAGAVLKETKKEFREYQKQQAAH
jgi:SprT-like family